MGQGARQPPYKIGVVGIGDISDVYINNLKTYDIVEVVGCAGRDLGKAKERAAAHSLEKAYADGFALITDPDIDIILNLTIPAAHAELNLAALNAGKHVYTEKPLAATFADAASIMTLARERGLYVGCAPDTFLGGRLQTCRKLIDDGTIGDIVGAGAFVVSHGHEWFHPNPDFFYKPGGGPLLDIGPYYMTALLSLLGPVTDCGAMARRTFSERSIESTPRRGEKIAVEVDTHITGSLEFANGAIATLLASFDVWDSELPRLEIYGTRATLCLADIDPVDGPNLFGGTLRMRNVDNYRWKGLPRSNAQAPWTEVPIVHKFNELSHRKNSRGIGLVDMAYAIRDGRKERASGEMALRALDVMECLLRSAKDRCFAKPSTTFERPAPMPTDFPDHL